jgi:endonuclease/exonuclease/phosphatase family metal-dependent hydrolase
MTLRILSYNIREGGGDRLDRLCEVMRQQDADAIALLEAASRRNAEWLAQALGMELVYGEANNQQGDIAWLSRLPISRARNQRHPALAKTLVEIEVLADDAPVTLFATHLASRWDAVIPEAEVPIILERLREAGDRLHALVGDFNALRPGDPVGEPPGAEIRRGDAVDGAPRRTIQQILGAGYVDCYRSRHPASPGYTYPSYHRWLRLDYIFASPALAPWLVTCDVVQDDPATTASDHLPVVAEFELIARIGSHLS